LSSTYDHVEKKIRRCQEETWKGVRVKESGSTAAVITTASLLEASEELDVREFTLFLEMLQ
jgi:hypothetical protein